MTALHLIEAAVGLGLASLVAWRLYRLPAVLQRRGIAQSLGALTVDPPLADQPADLPWVAQLTPPPPNGPSLPATTTKGAGDWYDPTVETVAETFNEFGFITSPSPAPVNPRTGLVPMTNADVCAWIGHALPVNGACPRCGVAIA